MYAHVHFDKLALFEIIPIYYYIKQFFTRIQFLYAVMPGK